MNSVFLVNNGDNSSIIICASLKHAEQVRDKLNQEYFLDIQKTKNTTEYIKKCKPLYLIKQIYLTLGA